MDTRTEERRRRIMQAVWTSDTGSEMIVRRPPHRLGYRYRIHRNATGGKGRLLDGMECAGDMAVR